MNLSGKFIQGTGGYEVKEASADDGIIKKGMQYLECTSSGTLAFPSDQAYGEWEFDLYKPNSGASEIAFVADAITHRANNGYFFLFDGSEDIRLYRNTNTTLQAQFLSATGYLDINTWYRIKITRTLDGEFYVYVKGGDFGTDDWTLVVAGVSGSNPVTENTFTSSGYFVIDLDVGGRIANIITRKAVKQ